VATIDLMRELLSGMPFWPVLVVAFLFPPSKAADPGIWEFV